jgi:C4-dicarboxylate-specific signal transduction histidine kinase
MQAIFSTKRRRRGQLSLSVRVSLLLMLAALLPLIVTIISSELLSRPQLIAQANASMESDARTHIQTIDNYFSQPIIDVRSLSQNPFLSEYLNGNTQVATEAINVLATGYQRNTHYLNWSLIDTQGKQRLFYPTPAQPHGPYFIPPDTAKQLTAANEAAISSDFYNPEGNQLTVDITEPVTTVQGNTTRILGYLRLTLNINFIWNIVLNEINANGAGSYAFITDENGVIIAHSDITQNFTAIAPFTASEQQNISTLQRYGANTNISAPGYHHFTNAPEGSTQIVTSQIVPPGQETSYQVIGVPVSIVPWTYFVLSPTNVVTALADQQLLNIGIIALIVLLMAAVTGIIVGRRITAPVLHSVSKLQASSTHLKELAAKEQLTITEQSWVVDASQTGLTTINYYVDATQEAANRIIKTGTELERYWPQISPEHAGEVLHQIVVAAHYIENAVQYQQTNGKKLSAAIDLTQQVTEQLTSSADAAIQAAEQMEQVVSQLQQVVGKE